MMGEAAAASSAQHRPRSRPLGADEADHTRWLLCRAGAYLCALPIEQVAEIMRLLPIERISGAPKYLRGLSIIRGVPVPVVDLGLIIGDQITPTTRLITIKAAARTIALAVETVVGITAIAAEAAGRLPPLLRDAATETVSAIGARDTELIIFLHAARLVPEGVFTCLDAGNAPS
jgi:purine-binding chemotaxis protein CheW